MTHDLTSVWLCGEELRRGGEKAERRWPVPHPAGPFQDSLERALDGLEHFQLGLTESRQIIFKVIINAAIQDL